MNNLSFYAGANTPYGFYSLYGKLYPFEKLKDQIVLKGGAGCGKSTFMRIIGDAASSNGLSAEYLYCSSDPESLDGILIPEKGILVTDGTAPHVMEPYLPGIIGRYINLGDFYDTEALRGKKDDIKELTEKCSAGFAAAYRFLAAANDLSKDIAKDISPLSPSIERRTNGIIAREFKKKGVSYGHESVRFLSAIGPGGVDCRYDTVRTLAERVYELCSDYSLAREMLSRIRKAALSRGYDIISCRCPMDPDGTPEHIIIPSLSLAFVSSHSYHPYDSSTFRRIHLDNYIDRKLLLQHRRRLRFSIKTKNALIAEACNVLMETHLLHDRLEEIYNPHVDFDSVKKLAEKTAFELFN